MLNEETMGLLSEEELIEISQLKIKQVSATEASTGAKAAAGAGMALYGAMAAVV